jgi:Replication initiator protein, pSAM2
MSALPDPAAVPYTGRCLQPVLLRGGVDHVNGRTGELLHRYTTVHEPSGVLRVACKTRRASRCPPCAEIYRADTYQLIRAGLSGGKGVTTAVSSHPCVFLTLTAPSFGPVHVRREKNGRVLRCRPRRQGRNCPHGAALSCPLRHDRDDPLCGQPLCPEGYDYTGSVLFNACSPELWRRFTIALQRSLAREAGITGKMLAAQLRISYAKVAEYQRRGVVHFHAVIRLDGPAGPTTTPPAWATPGALTAAIDQAARAVHLDLPATPGIPARTVRFGRQHDIRPITSTGDVTDSRVAAYVAKYATKAAECTGTLDRRIAPADKLAHLPIREHARRLIAECLRLGRLPGLADLRLTAWAHMLGFRGHFSTKSRVYSTTMTALRAERARHQREADATPSLWPEPEDDTTLVIGHWQFVGQNYRLPPPLPADRPAVPARDADGGQPCPASC